MYVCMCVCIYVPRYIRGLLYLKRESPPVSVVLVDLYVCVHERM